MQVKMISMQCSVVGQGGYKNNGTPENAVPAPVPVPVPVPVRVVMVMVA